MNDITKDKIRNGTIWETEAGNVVTIQWVEQDTFMLLTGPHKARHGGSCLLTYKDEKGDVLFSVEQVVDVLTKRKATETDRMLVCTIR